MVSGCCVSVVSLTGTRSAVILKDIGRFQFKLSDVISNSYPRLKTVGLVQEKCSGFYNNNPWSSLRILYFQAKHKECYEKSQSCPFTYAPWRPVPSLNILVIFMFLDIVVFPTSALTTKPIMMIQASSNMVLLSFLNRSEISRRKGTGLGGQTGKIHLYR